MPEGEAVAFARSVLSLIEDKLYFTELDELAGKYVGPRPSDKLRFNNNLYKFIKTLPLALWEDQEQRKKFLTEYINYLESETIRELGRSKFNKLSDNTVREKSNILDKNVSSRHVSGKHVSGKHVSGKPVSGKPVSGKK